MTIAISAKRQERIDAGRQFESEFWGFRPVFDPSKFYCGERKPTFYELIKEILRQQKASSRNLKEPENCLNAKLFRIVKEGLPRRFQDELVTCPTTGTPLEHYGVDGFFALECHIGSPLTVDLVLGKKGKHRKARANIVICKQDMFRPITVMTIANIMTSHLVDAARTRMLSTRQRLW